MESNKPLDSMMINNAVEKLPKGHLWGSVRLEMGVHVDKDGNAQRMPLCVAKCTDCGKTVSYTPEGWLDSVSLG